MLMLLSHCGTTSIFVVLCSVRSPGSRKALRRRDQVNKGFLQEATITERGLLTGSERGMNVTIEYACLETTTIIEQRQRYKPS